MNQIESLFCDIPEDEDVVKTVYLTGQPGSGKTELARQYGEQFNNKTSLDDTSKPLVITLNGNSEESLFKSVNEIARKLRLPVCTEQTIPNLSNMMKDLKDHFRAYSGAWLLIVDDMFENSFNNLFPRPGSKEWGGGRVLVTTQDNDLVPACHQFAKKLSLNEGMTKEDALALLEEICEVEVDDYAKEIIEELRYLPLALACCATYVGETREDRASTQFGWKECLELYRKNVKLESRTFPNHNHAYPFSMTTAIKMAVSKMAEKSDVLRLTFSFLSYCALSPVPLSALATYVNSKLPAEKRTSTTLRGIEDEICRCSLFVHKRYLTVETILFHQTICHVFKSTANVNPVEYRESEFVQMMKSLNVLLDTMDHVNEQDMIIKVLMRPHLQSFVNHANKMEWNNTADFVLISMKNGHSLFVTSNLSGEEAIKSLETLRKISLDLNLPERKLCDILANLGFYNLQLDREDRYEDALNFLTEAYNMTENKAEEEWLILRCRISFNLARVHCKKGDGNRGVNLMKESIYLAKTVYRNEEQNIMARYLWLARFYYENEKFGELNNVKDEAQSFLSSCTPDSVNLNRAYSLCYLGQIYVFHGLHQASSNPEWWTMENSLILAHTYINRYLNMFEKVLGDDIYLCADSAVCIYLISNAIGMSLINPDESKKHLETAHKISLRLGNKVILETVVELQKSLFPKRSIWDFIFFC